jgi:hypothetical protein
MDNRSQDERTREAAQAGGGGSDAREEDEVGGEGGDANEQRGQAVCNGSGGLARDPEWAGRVGMRHAQGYECGEEEGVRGREEHHLNLD